MLGLRYIILLSLFCPCVGADLGKAWSLMRRSRGSVANYPAIVGHLVGEGLYYASVPYIKEYLTSSRAIRSASIDPLIDKVVGQVGIKQFEVLPERFLERSHAPMLRYILAKKHFRRARYDDALRALGSGIDGDHPTKPFALHLEGAIMSIKRQYAMAKTKFQGCVASSNRFMGNYSGPNRRKQLVINRDACLAGIARNYFSAGDFQKANLAYLDIDKSSMVWPEILFEEAWNSFYRGNYNRTLGKLVTYKAPVLDFIHNPEIDVLRALSYMELCLWNDAQKSVDEFYGRYERSVSQAKAMVRRNRKNVKYFYLMAENGKVEKTHNSFIDTLIASLDRDAAYQELHQSLLDGRSEVERVSRIRNVRLKRRLASNINDTMNLQKSLIGGYVRKVVLNALRSINKMFEGMSYIKLEVLSRRKTMLYGEESSRGRSRGSLKNLKRNDKQYFWTFNGEFWADELGDYVFALKSECR